MAVPDFWRDHEAAKTTSQKAGALRALLADWDKLLAEVNSLQTLAEESAAIDESLVEEEYNRLLELLAKLETTLLLSEKYDDHDAIMAIHAGSGGTEAQDWAAMLLRMYLRYAEAHNFKTRILDESKGEVAGLKSVTLEVRGLLAYGYLKGEHGVHRLVRISPFDAEKMRHTSFALVEVVPMLQDVEEMAIDPKDLRIDTFMSGGHGGQSVNTTYSAVRIVHIPTGLSVSCQNERSQLQNKATALKILQGKLHKLAIAEQQEEKQKLRGEYQSAEWGNQVRSYVLQPYKLVKDHRTKFETSDTDDVLEGGLDALIESYLKYAFSK
jgi:peptide chain release factor 2